MMADTGRFERSFKSGVASVLRRLVGSRETAFPFPADVRSILVVRQHNQLGDMLCVVPLLRALRARFPGARIALLASPGNRDIMRHHPCLDEVLTYDKTEFLLDGRLHPVRFVRYVRELRTLAFDLAVVPSTVSVSFSSDALAYLSGAPCRVGARSLGGAQNPSGFFFTIARDLHWEGERNRHQTLRNWDILAPWLDPPSSLSHEMGFTTAEKEAGSEFVTRTRGTKGLAIAYHPGAGKPPNRWPAERFAELANTLALEFDAMTYVTEGPMDEDEVRQMESGLHVPYQVIRHQPIRSVASILAQLDLVVSNDTGIMHVAAAAGTPVLSLFGPTDPRQWAPIGGQNRFIEAEGGRIETIPLGTVLEGARAILSLLRPPANLDRNRAR
ncbi:MAG: opsX [Bacteroidetes bacterium]|nr:opsX [Bacteroidota bacterium]